MRNSLERNGFPFRPRRVGRTQFQASRVVVLLALLATAPAVASNATPIEPTVSRREAAQIEAANAMATTNAAAAIELLGAQDLTKSSAAMDFVLGNLYVQADRLDEACQAYRRAIATFPTFVNAHRNLGRTLLMHDKPRDAFEALREVVAIGAADADTYTLLGHAGFLAERPVSAEAAYRQALLLDMDHLGATRGLIKALARQARYAEAAALCAELLGRTPADGEIWALRANALLMAGRENEAIDTLETASRLDGLKGEGRLLLADLYINNRQPADAIRHYVIAIDAGASPARALRAVDAFLMLGDTTRAGELLTRVEHQAPDTLADADRTRLRYLRARMLHVLGEHAAADEMLAKLLADDPLNGEALLLAGDVYAARNELEPAAMAYERAARVRGCELQALVKHAQLEVGRSQWQRAVELLEAALRFENRPDVTRYLEQVRRMAQQEEARHDRRGGG